MATTSRILAGPHLRRQWQQNSNSSAQLLRVQQYASRILQNNAVTRPISYHALTPPLSSLLLPTTQRQQCPRRTHHPNRREWQQCHHLPQRQQQQQQQRYLSDRLKRRAIDALKSKSKEGAAAVNDDDDGGKFKNGGDDKAGKGGFKNENESVVAEPSKDDTIAAAKTTPKTVSAKPEPEPIVEAAAVPPASAPATDDDADANATVSTDASAAPESSSPAADSDDSADAGVESNPWAHVHLHEFAPKIVVVGVGGAGTNAVNNMVAGGLAGVEFLALNTDAQHLSTSLSPNRLQIGTHLTSGLGCGANPDAGRLAAEESSEAIQSCIEDAHMVFITAGMGGGTGTGAAPVVAGLCYDLGILTVSVVTTPFRFEGTHRRRLALEGVDRLKEVSDTLICVPNQNLFRLVGEKTSFVDSFRLADDVLLAGVRSVTDLMTSPGLINLDFADVQSVMHGMGNALLGTGQACHDDVVGSFGIGEAGGGGKEEGAEERSADGSPEVECRAVRAAKMALNNPLLGEGNMDVGSAKGMLVNMSGGSDMTLYEVDRAAEYITERVLDPDANIIFGSAFDANLNGCVRVSVVATGIDEGE